MQQRIAHGLEEGQSHHGILVLQAIYGELLVQASCNFFGSNSQCSKYVICCCSFVNHPLHQETFDSYRDSQWLDTRMKGFVSPFPIYLTVSLVNSLTAIGIYMNQLF